MSDESPEFYTRTQGRSKRYNKKNLLTDKQQSVIKCVRKYPKVRMRIDLMTEEEQNKIADELLAYVRQEPRPRNIRPFFQDRGMSFYRFKQSAEHYNDYLKEALIMSGEMIGDLLHDKWMDFEINPSAAKSRMIGIDRDFKESLAEEKSLDQKQVETGIRLVEYKQYIDVKEEKK